MHLSDSPFARQMIGIGFPVQRLWSTSARHRRLRRFAATLLSLVNSRVNTCHQLAGRPDCQSRRLMRAHVSSRRYVHPLDHNIAQPRRRIPPGMLATWPSISERNRCLLPCPSRIGNESTHGRVRHGRNGCLAEHRMASRNLSPYSAHERPHTVSNGNCGLHNDTFAHIGAHIILQRENLSTSNQGELEEQLVRLYGVIIGGAALHHALGFSTASAFKRAFSRGVLTVHTFRIPGRRGRFATARDVAQWVTHVSAVCGHSDLGGTK